MELAETRGGRPRRKAARVGEREAERAQGEFASTPNSIAAGRLCPGAQVQCSQKIAQSAPKPLDPAGLGLPLT